MAMSGAALWARAAGLISWWRRAALCGLVSADIFVAWFVVGVCRLVPVWVVVVVVAAARSACHDVTGAPVMDGLLTS